MPRRTIKPLDMNGPLRLSKLVIVEVINLAERGTADRRLLVQGQAELVQEREPSKPVVSLDLDDRMRQDLMSALYGRPTAGLPGLADHLSGLLNRPTNPPASPLDLGAIGGGGSKKRTRSTTVVGARRCVTCGIERPAEQYNGPRARTCDFCRTAPSIRIVSGGLPSHGKDRRS